MATPPINLADADLLRAFVREGSESAFRSLTDRHVNLVFGTALRRTGHREAAQEITQNVFIALARKAAWLQVRRSLAGWLYRTTLLEARQWRRGETRRGQRELTAAELETTMKTTDTRLSPMVEVPDEGLVELSESERQVLLLRFLEGRNHREIGFQLGIGLGRPLWWITSQIGATPIRMCLTNPESHDFLALPHSRRLRLCQPRPLATAIHQPGAP